MTYDLEERTAVFGEAIISFCKKIPQDVISRVLVAQLVRSATSIGANYAEANGAGSRKDFLNKIFICKKESQETKHWIRMCMSAFPVQKEVLVSLSKEAHELTLIFQAIAISTRKRISETEN